MDGGDRILSVRERLQKARAVAAIEQEVGKHEHAGDLPEQRHAAVPIADSGQTEVVFECPLIAERACYRQKFDFRAGYDRVIFHQAINVGPMSLLTAENAKT